MIVGSRQVYTGVFRFALVSLLAIMLFAGTAYLIAVLLASYQDSTWNRPVSVISGLSCSLIIWLFVASFHLRRETHQLPIPEWGPFLLEAKTILHEMGYVPSSQDPDDPIYRPRFHALLFGGGIRLEPEGHAAKLTGPKVSLELFRRRYRLLHHVHRVQQVLHDHRKFTDNMLKRVELRLRLKPEQLASVNENVIALLQKDGEVICELNLLVHCDQGICENTLEFQIREWIEQHNIPCAIHKDLVQFVETVQNAKAADAVTV